MTDKPVFTKLNRGLAGFHSPLSYLSTVNQGRSAVSPTRISNNAVTPSEYNNSLTLLSVAQPRRAALGMALPTQHTATRVPDQMLVCSPDPMQCMRA